MNNILSFINHVIIIPILPCLANIFVKIICNSPFGLEYLDKGTLSFSISLYFLICFRGSLKITDENLGKNLSAIYIIFFFSSICIFILGLTFDTLFNMDLTSYVNSILEFNDKKVCSIESFSSKFKQSTINVGISTIVFSVLSVIYSEKLRRKYKIEGEII